jgi:hypothetical protein
MDQWQHRRPVGRTPIFLCLLEAGKTEASWIIVNAFSHFSPSPPVINQFTKPPHYPLGSLLQSLPEMGSARRE